MRKKNSESVSPKIDPIEGTLEYKKIRCGRNNCKCARGELHGRYAYLRVQVAGLRYRTYVKKKDLPQVIAGIEAHRKLQQEARAERDAIKQLFADLREQTRIWIAQMRERQKKGGLYE